MQKNQKIMAVIIGTFLLVSIIATGTSASPIASGKEVSASQPFSAQFPAGSAGVSCTTCHAMKASPEDWSRLSASNHTAYLSIYNQILYAHSTSHIDTSNVNLNLSQEAINTILTHQQAEQSIRLESDSDPIVQCRFCHSGEAQYATLLNSE